MIESWFIDWIKKHEGFRAQAYLDKGQYSIGYGSATMPDGKLVKAGDVITEEEAAKLIP
jgi:GH24 family phage-related lysozyme (muramidase)